MSKNSSNLYNQKDLIDIWRKIKIHSAIRYFSQEKGPELTYSPADKHDRKQAKTFMSTNNKNKDSNLKSRTGSNNSFETNIALLGGGNIGCAIARGLVNKAGYEPAQIYLTRRQTKSLGRFKKKGFQVTTDNRRAVAHCKTIIIAVQPTQLNELLTSIRTAIVPDKHIILSAVAGISNKEVSERLKSKVPVVRIMPNTAVAIGESMTCLAANGQRGRAIITAEKLFGQLGRTLVIPEEHMIPATALCACGVAFFLRSVRAASQGGIQIGFHAEEALEMAAQTARGAASLLLESNVHPESEIDKVTTPQGCTIAGLNRMEHEGFSSAMIKGLVTATEIAGSFSPDKNGDGSDD